MRQVVNSFIKKHSLLFRGATVIVGVSGGPDSLALLHFLKSEEKRMNLRIIAAHVDHMFRGDESAADYAFVEDYCNKESIEFEGVHINVRQYQEQHKLSSQVAARECRYDFFSSVMNKHGAQVLALAHHGDDQVETMIMRQIRGAQGFGLAGIPVKRPFSRGMIIRPFLCLSKDEIYHYCGTEGLNPRIDESNFTSKYMRNRIRNGILPVLKVENPAVHERFQQQSELRFEDELFLESLAEQEISKVILSKKPQKVVLSISTLNDMAIPLQRRGFQLILNYLYEQNIPEITSIHIEQFLTLVKNAHPSGSLSFPNGLRISKSYDYCTLSFDNETKVSGFSYQLLVPGIVTVKKGKIIGEVTDFFPTLKLNKKVIICDFEKIKLPLMVRNRRPGDNMSLQGMSGTKKLKSLFIDEKIQRENRDDWPIVVNGNGEILWVPGLRRSNFALPTLDTKKFLVLYYETSLQLDLPT
ncbi:tRNA lysidine(34) synthetase TilS [Anaerobacillus sp. CMMVII]|uniref:tRNA lysidine(34) synthetase TilS n=1 Tax=Anaerobacillus sp. CMMVII TaxID=2755588 RepID=UPI0021B848BB|nr:tRNA lysidine(34) synthetase TilS [Anaerobacillus sp. CMMVII]MCT8136386.1 tRNA lysidine(34) synthetase TilS [Anaerobacillus sp. CMMVII]